MPTVPSPARRVVKLLGMVNAVPDGETIEVLAAPINPIDTAISRGVLATGHPELPYVPGCEAVGRRPDGQLVWIFGGSLGRTSAGAIAERALAARVATVGSDCTAVTPYAPSPDARIRENPRERAGACG